jgi:hypothetical protein
MYVFHHELPANSNNNSNEKKSSERPLPKMTQYAEGSLFYYDPNKVAPIVFSALFILSGLLHFYQT